MYAHTHSEQELGEVDALGGPYQRHATEQNTHVTESAPGDQAGNTSVKMVGLGHLTWLSVKMAVKSPDLSQNCGGHMLYGEATFLS